MHMGINQTRQQHFARYINPFTVRYRFRQRSGNQTGNFFILNQQIRIHDSLRKHNFSARKQLSIGHNKNPPMMCSFSSYITHHR